ncbi:MAG: hypothetical protein Q8N30_09470, partial [Methylococcales bacterium]|nr:hypothetical protein [Methylococcales bacterium]
SRCIASRLANLVTFAGWTGNFLVAGHNVLCGLIGFSAPNFNLIYRFNPLPAFGIQLQLK